MAQRWAQSKMDRNRMLRDRAAGRSERFEEQDFDGRACALPTSIEVKQLERVAIETCNLKAKRAPCTGRLDDVTRKGRNMRKARGEIVRPESGRIAVNAGKIAAPPMKGFLQRCWSTNQEWVIYKKGE